jgi:tetratricopeptide (TPR) repeat protein
MTTTDIDVEALRAQIDAEDDPSGKADLYDRLSYALQMTDPAGSFTASAAALRIETGLGDVSRISRSCLRIGDYFRHVGKYRSASRWIMKAWRAVADLDGHHFRKAEILRRQAALHHAWGDNVSALDALERSLAICRRPDAPYDDQGQVAATLGYMGEIYTEVGDLGRALQVFSEALETFEERNNRRAVGKTLFNIGRVHAALGDRDEALAVFERSLAHSRSVGNRFAEANCLIQIGIILREQGSLAAALAQHDGALELCRQIENRFGQASALCEIARTLRQMGERERAIASIDEARTIFEEIGDHGGRLQALQTTGEIHLHDLMYRDAIEAFLRAHALAAEIGHRKEQCELQRLLAEAH